MERKCKNCMCFYPAPAHGDGCKGMCDRTGDLVIHHREDTCDCASYIELPKVEKVKRTIEKVLKPWIRERDAMFIRSMELVDHISQLFGQGEFKVFDAVKSAAELKGLVFFGKSTINNIDKIWTYHCPWDDDIELFIAITNDKWLALNTIQNNKFLTKWIDTDNIDVCFNIIDAIRDSCIMKIQTISDGEIEYNKCIETS